MINLDLTKKYVLAVSGGIDSMVMLHCFAAYCPRPNFSVVTVNHGIRTEAQSDCEFVKRYCGELGVSCEIYIVNVPEYSKESKLSEETAARILRYKVLDGIDCDYVCLAHHQGDNAETVLMHVLRGSGALGASGIKRQNGKYLRPLLDMSRDEIERYASEHNVPFVNDSTNDETKYTRNYIRKKIIPALKELNPSAEQNIIRFAENIAADNEYLDSLADISTVEFSFNSARIPVSLLIQPQPIAYRILSKTFRQLGVVKDVERTHVDAIIGLAQGQGGRKAYLPFGYIAVNDYEYVTIEQLEITDESEYELPSALGQTVTPVGVVEVSQTERTDCLKIDVNKLPVDAVFRFKRQGDVFAKFGGGSKPLKKYLIDRKIPQRQRQNLLLVASGNEVFVILGVEISEKLKVTDESNVYYISIKKENVL